MKNLDFSIESYINYINLISKKGFSFLRYDEYFLQNNLNIKICLIRHDVDRKPYNALRMARIENSLGVKSTYYFRTKPHTLKKKLIKEISSLGHEIGYHYESLSDTNGNIIEAINDFKKNLGILREIVPIKTCAMHGRPLNKYDNRNMWRTKDNHNILINELEMLGEVYLDIVYKDIAYINDTGRNWESSKSNKRDKVFSNIKTSFESQKLLISYLEKTDIKKIVFQIHPERWDDNYFSWVLQLIIDKLSNFIKKLIK
jgi:hypothetical protein